jgi:localization factor PodJL
MPISYGQGGTDNGEPRTRLGEEGQLRMGGGIERVLDAVIGRIAAAEQRQTQALEAMQQRISQLTSSAFDARNQIPSEFREDFGRLEDAMTRLAARVSETARQSDGGVTAATGPGDPTQSTAVDESAMAAAKKRLAMLDINDLVDQATAGDPEQPWDHDAAEELTRLYETGAAGLPFATAGRYGRQAPDYMSSVSSRALELTGNGCGGARDSKAPASAQSYPPPRPALDKEWLEERFSAVATRIEQILLEQKSDAPFEVFDERFTTLEQRFGAAVQDLAKRSDVAGLGDVEACIAEMAEQLELAHAQLARVAEIETQVRELASRVSEERLSALANPMITPVDVDEIASVVVDRLADKGFGETPAAPPAIDVAEIAHLVAEQLAGHGLGNPTPSMPPLDVDEIASVVVERMAEFRPEPYSIGLSAESEAQLAELKVLVKGLVETKRDDSEHTSTMLDTMQQAMIRLLDRMEALEEGTAGGSAPMPGYAAQQAPLQPAPTLSHGSATQGDERVFDVREAAAVAPSLIRGNPVSNQDHEKEVREAFGLKSGPTAQHQARDRREEDVWRETEPDFPPAGGTTGHDHACDADEQDPLRNRRHFMEAARRAAQQANQKARMTQVAPDAGDRHAPYYEPADAELEEAPQKRSLFGFGLKRRVVVAAIAIILIGAGAGALMMKSSSLLARHFSTAEISSNTQRGDMLGQTGTPPLAPVNMPAATGPATEETADPAATESGEVQPDGTGGTSPATATPQSELERRERHRQYAMWSGNVGERMPAAENIPASLIPTPDEAEATTPPTTDGITGQRTTALPSALVGPLSLRLAAANGDASAEFEVGARFAEGKGIQQDFKQAITWYRRSATRGFALAQYRLATLYERGLGVSKDLARARIWYERAASQGNVKAMHNLAVLAAAGTPEKPDYGLAARWFDEAAGRGLGDSQFNLAILYQSGLGVQRDLAQAYKWFGIAARSGDKSASQRQAEVARQMKATEIAAADREISTWRKKSTSRLANDPHYAGEEWKQRAKSQN